MFLEEHKNWGALAGMVKMANFFCYTRKAGEISEVNGSVRADPNGKNKLHYSPNGLGKKRETKFQQKGRRTLVVVELLNRDGGCHRN
jgi:hypothetical protein